MKKLLLFIGLLLFVIPVQAKTIYSEPKDFSSWQEQEVKETDTLKVESKKMYKYYYLKSVDGGYFGENDDYKDFDMLSLENKKYGEWSPWQEESVVSTMYKEVESKDAYLYTKSKGVRYVYITDVHGSNGALRINELNFDIDGKTVYPKINSCVGCNDTFYPYIFNGVLNQNMSSISNGGNIILDLEDYYDPSTIKLKMWIYDRGIEPKTFNIYYIHDLDVNKPYAHYNYFGEYTNSNLSDTPLTELPIDIFAIDGNNIEFGSDQISLEEIVPNDFTRVDKIKAYRYRSIAYLRYKNIPVYSEYQDNSDNIYILKSDDYKTYYRYAPRHYLNVQDNIILKDNNLEQHIQSDLPYKMASNIDFKTNGTYKVKAYNDYLSYEFDVKVDIDSTKDKQINANTETINNLNSEVEALEEANKYLNTTIDLKEQEKADISHNYENKLESKSNVISNLTNSTESVSVKASSFASNDKFYIGLGVLFISLLTATYIYFRK